MSPLLAAYMAMFYFGSVATGYRPLDLEKMREGKFAWVIEEMLATQGEQFPYMIASKHLCHIWGRPAESDERPVGEPGIGRVPGTIVEASGEVYVVCGEGTWLRLEALHLEGRKRVTAQEFARGARLTQHERFGT